MTSYRVIVEGTSDGFHRAFDGEPQIDLTFEHDGGVYRIVTRAHDEDTQDEPTFHARPI